ncbi:MAG: NAD+ synthase, partial [Gammaproteobacteria bacterium]|nr:NAD+ synthase [Gammaproteobacteria bacterium]
MSGKLKISLAQLNFHVGNIAANTSKMIDAIAQAEADKADLLVFSELSITGYPPEDLLFRQGLYEQVNAALVEICSYVINLDVIVGYPRYVEDKIYNSACLIRKGEIFAVYDKWALPNYSVFDEKRYFHSGALSCVVDIKGVPTGLTICEDIWEQEPIKAAVRHGAKLVININASPFDLKKMEIRESEVRKRVEETNVPVVYVNQVGGQDELVFDGASFVMNASGDIVCRLPAFVEQQTNVSFDIKSVIPEVIKVHPHPSTNQAVFDTLVLGVRDYVTKNGFSGVVLGLSGGI